MGNTQSNAQVDPAHLRIYNTLLQVQNIAKRQELLETLLAGPEYIQSAKRAGIYGDVLAYVGYLRRGQTPLAPLPGEWSSQGPHSGKATEWLERSSATPQGSSQPHSGKATALQPLLSQPHQQPQQRQPQNQLAYPGKKPQLDPVKILGKQKNSEKALSFFTTCLRVLELQEEVALTEEALKKAYKKKAISAHPDKGGSEEQFESITRAYAYLTEILKLVKGQRTKEGEQAALPAIDTVKGQRNEASVGFQHAEPVRLDPKNLNMETFNRMFEQTRIPDPDDDGYGDWLKNEEAATASSSKFSGKFNRNVFNKMFEDEARTRAAGSRNDQQLSVLSPQALMMAPSLGLEIGRDKPQTYTAPANAQLHYTDLRHAYTSGSTFSGEVSGVSAAPRSLESYKAARKNIELSDEERAAIAQQEAAMADAESRRQIRAARENVVADDYFERMKRLVIRDN